MHIPSHDSTLNIAVAPKLPVIVVDMDGTLTPVDTLHEITLRLLADKPMVLPVLIAALLKGKSKFKNSTAIESEISGEQFPINAALCSWLKQKKLEGHAIWLATGSNVRLAQSVAEHLGIFDEILASTEAINLVGTTKLEEITKLLEGREFWYAGNSRADLPIWEAAHGAILVGPNRAALEAGRQYGRVVLDLESKGCTAKDVLRAARPQQWLKNLLVFLPIIAAHRWADAKSVAMAVATFVAFSICASSVYLTNDALDVKSDRRHPKKSKRPIAAGILTVATAIQIACVGFCTSLVVAGFVSWKACACIFLYFMVTLSYSMALKRKVLVDVFLLASLYMYRIVVGGIVTNISISPWLMVFGGFSFLSLAFAKRYTEIVRLQSMNTVEARGYRPTDGPFIGACGVASCFSAVLILSLYLNSDSVTEIYSAPQILWIWLPTTLFWFLRLWMIAFRGELNHDPVAFAARDKITYVVAAVVASTLYVAASLSF